AGPHAFECSGDASNFDVRANAHREVPRVVGVPDGELGVFVREQAAGGHLRLHGHGAESAEGGGDVFARHDVGIDRVQLAVAGDHEVHVRAGPEVEAAELVDERDRIEHGLGGVHDLVRLAGALAHDHAVRAVDGRHVVFL